MAHDAFVRLMQTIASFTDDAVYLEPQEEHRYEGPSELYDFFGGQDPERRGLALARVPDRVVRAVGRVRRAEPILMREGVRSLGGTRQGSDTSDLRFR